MKKILLLPLTLLLLAGCVSTPNGDRVPDVALMSAVAKDAAFLGSSLYLQSKPQERPKFVATRDALNTLIAAGQFDTAALTAALTNLPIRELKGDKGSFYVGIAITLWDAYGRRLAQLDQGKVFEGYILPVAIAIRDGLNLSLAPPQAPPMPPRSEIPPTLKVISAGGTWHAQ